MTKKYHSKSFEELLAAHEGLLKSLAKQHIKRFPPDLYSLDDLIQIGTMALWQAANKYQGDLGAKISTFAYACINNALRTEYNTLVRQKRGSGEADFQLDQAIEDTYSTETFTDYRLADFINALNPGDRSILLMRLHGYTAAEIAATLGKSKSYIPKKILKLKRQLKEYLEV